LLLFLQKKKILLFLKEKKQKNFISSAVAPGVFYDSDCGDCGAAQCGEVHAV
jgi:hypothetical protein